MRLVGRSTRKVAAEARQRFVQAPFLAASGPRDAHAGGRNGFAQSRRPRRRQSLVGPAVAQPECAIAFPAAADDHAVGAGAQRVLDERRRQLSGAQKVGAGLTTIAEVLRVAPASQSR